MYSNPCESSTEAAPPLHSVGAGHLGKLVHEDSPLFFASSINLFSLLPPHSRTNSCPPFVLATDFPTPGVDAPLLLLFGLGLAGVRNGSSLL